MNDRGISYSVSKIFEVPLPAAYAWCTDFRDDDPEIAKSTATRHIVDKGGGDRVIWISTAMRGGERREGISIVTLRPPDSWHVDVFAKDENLVGEYRMTSLADNRTKLDMTFRIRYKGDFATPSKEEREASTSQLWENYKRALEAESKADSADTHRI